jgi:hypothetical protein
MPAGRATSPADRPGDSSDRPQQLLERFAEAWRRGERPAIEDYLAGPDERMAVLAGLCHVELEWRLRQGEAARAEDYLARFPQLHVLPQAVVDLAAAEFAALVRRGERPQPQSYLERFPPHAEALRGCLGLAPVSSGAVTSALYAPPEPEGLLPKAPTTRAAGGSAGPGEVSGVSTTLLPQVPGYQVLAVLGEGGMGVVYKARQEGLNRVVALKRVRRDYAAESQALGRFRAEAEAVARLAHPHIVSVYAWGEHDGCPYFALEYCPGGSLDKAVAGQPQPPPGAARLVEKLARAVQAAHEAGVVHRDLKPANVLLAPPGDEPALNTPWGVPKVADFGLCRLLQAEGQRTAEGAVAGTPQYMAPEQAEGRGQDIGPATDVWALGVILYEMLTGRRPFQAGSTPATLRAVCQDEPPRPMRLQAGVPAELEAICLRCLRKRPGERYARAADLAEALRGWLAGAEAGRQAPPQKPAPGGKSIRPGRGLLAASVLAALFLAAFWAWWNRPTGPAPAAPAVVSPAQIPAAGPERSTKPLTVDLKVWKVESEGFNNRVAGQLGRDVFRVRLNDAVRVEARLSEPAYAYFLAFNPAQEEDHRVQCFPEDHRGRAPDRLDRAGPDETITLDDGVGLQAFAVVASRQPLPPFTQWRRQHASLGWDRVRATSRVLWLADGKDVDGLYGPGFNRATEGQKGDKALVRKLAAGLRGLPGVEAVSVVGFAVDPAD